MLIKVTSVADQPLDNNNTINHYHNLESYTPHRRFISSAGSIQLRTSTWSTSLEQHRLRVLLSPASANRLRTYTLAPIDPSRQPSAQHRGIRTCTHHTSNPSVLILSTQERIKPYLRRSGECAAAGSQEIFNTSASRREPKDNCLRPRSAY